MECKTLKYLFEHKEYICGQESLPHLVNDDNSNLSLEERGMDEYENGSEILHVTKGISSCMFTLFKKEQDFQIDECSAVLDNEVRKGAVSGSMLNGDWRVVFCKFETCMS